MTYDELDEVYENFINGNIEAVKEKIKTIKDFQELYIYVSTIIDEEASKKILYTKIFD